MSLWVHRFAWPESVQRREGAGFLRERLRVNFWRYLGLQGCLQGASWLDSTHGRRESQWWLSLFLTLVVSSIGQGVSPRRFRYLGRRSFGESWSFGLENNQNKVDLFAAAQVPSGWTGTALSAKNLFPKTTPSLRLRVSCDTRGVSYGQHVHRRRAIF